ncbi:VOC family protein [Aquimarina sediminis]|uniref:VOC family protein n=1 Tax=Aquimarina sediminis TaxID=2070536 RepID=UPI000CA0447B|nr:VOC family protein [Aquimarina sediminis]
MIENKVKGLGEIVLRVNDMDKMKQFYQNIVGLELFNETKDFTFFKIAEGYNGHTQVLALFAKTNADAFDKVRDDIKQQHTSLHHFALEIDKKDYSDVLERLQSLDIDCVEEYFEWVQWKSIFIKDPEGNIVEFVCYNNKNE